MGYGLAEGKWFKIESLIQTALCESQVKVFVHSMFKFFFNASLEMTSIFAK